MKSFLEFTSEAKKVSLPVFNAKRLGYTSDEHGGWYDKNTGEFVAKTKGDRLKFYNKPQIVGQQDPKQDRRIPNRLVPKNHQTTEQYQKDLREKYINSQIFLEGDWVKNVNTDVIGKIIRRGTNYLICVTENNEMFKSWIKDAVEWTDVSGVPADQREVGTDELRNYVMKMTGTKEIKNFINKYKVRKS